jgi:hypothetical protein
MAGVSVAAQIGNAELELLAPRRQGWQPVLTGAGEAVKEQDRLARSVDFKIELDVVEEYRLGRVIGWMSF